MDGQLVINLGVPNTLGFIIRRLWHEIFFVQKCMLIRLFSYISLVLFADVTHTDTGQSAGRRKSIAILTDILPIACIV